MAIHSDTPPASAIVIVGGIVGSACALALQRRHVRTVVLDPEGGAKPASRGNAGHIAVEQVEPIASPATVRSLPHRLFSAGGPVALPPRQIRAWLPFLLRLLAASVPSRFRAGTAALSTLMADALPAWRRLLEDCEAPDLLVEDGHLVVWETARAAAAGRAAWRKASVGTARIRDATPDELRLVSGAMARPAAGAIRFEGTAQIADLDRLAETARESFHALGGETVRSTASALDDSSNRPSVRLDHGGRLEADAILVAAGVGSAPLLRAMGYRVPMIAKRGYHLHSAAPGWPLDLPPVVFEERSMIVTRFRSGVRAASFVEFGDADCPPDPRKWARLRRHIAELGLPIHEPIEQWHGARPTLPDYLPAIGRSRRPASFYYCFGHQHLGLRLAATSAELVASLVAGERTRMDLSPFDLNRFRGNR